MPRKRYVSTEISIDTRVRQLAERSEFAALLYTWMIPHATDDATITADPDELLMQVVPGFRWRTAEHVGEAVEAMLELHLVRRLGDRLKFPEKAFYQYQSYIGAERRGGPADPVPRNGAVDHPPPPDTADQRETPQNAADKNFAVEAPQNPASVKSSSSLTSSSSSSLSTELRFARGPARSSVRGAPPPLLPPIESSERENSTNGHAAYNADLALQIQDIGEELHDDSVASSITRAQRYQVAAGLEDWQMANAVKDARYRVRTRLEDGSRAPPSSPMAYFLGTLEHTTQERKAP